MRLVYACCVVIGVAGFAAGAAGCEAIGPGSQCGEGVPSEVDGRTLCVYEAPIIETGFDCPAEFPARMDYSTVVVCAPNGDIPPGQVDQLVEQFGQSGQPGTPGQPTPGGADQGGGDAQGPAADNGSADAAAGQGAPEPAAGASNGAPESDDHGAEPEHDDGEEPDDGDD